MLSATKRDIEIMNAELSGEYFGIAAYQAAIGTGLLEDEVRDVAEKFQGDHEQHARAIEEAIIGVGAEPVAAKTWDQYAAEYPPPSLQEQADIIRYAASLEKGGASAAVAAVGQLASAELAQLVASIAGVEAMHWSVLLGALGEHPAPVSFIELPAQPDAVKSPSMVEADSVRQAGLGH